MGCPERVEHGSPPLEQIDYFRSCSVPDRSVRLPGLSRGAPERARAHLESCIACKDTSNHQDSSILEKSTSVIRM
jgi:hypothetical protein